MRAVLFWDLGEIYRLSMGWDVGFMAGFQKTMGVFHSCLSYDLFCFLATLPRSGLLRHDSRELRVECFCAHTRYIRFEMISEYLMDPNVECLDVEPKGLSVVFYVH